MKKLQIIIILLISVISANSQDLIIYDSTYNVGIYKTFEEFRTNSPSIPFNYSIKTRSMGYGFMNMAGTVTFYSINLDRKEGKSIGSVFGFCDGNSIYINEGYPQLGPRAKFSKIEYLGKYSYFKDVKCNSNYNSMNNTFVTSCSLEEKVMDINDAGAVIRLTKKRLQNIIARDPEILKTFNQEKRKKKKLKEYLIKYLEKHPY